MKAVCVILSVLVVAAMATKTGERADRYNSFDVEAVVNDRCVLKSYMDCFLDDQFCNEITRTYRPDYLEAMLTACSHCTDKQKHVAHRFLDVSVELLPAESNILAKKMDPTGTLTPKIIAAVSAY